MYVCTSINTYLCIYLYRGSPQMPTRQRVQDAIAEYIRIHNITNSKSGQLDLCSRTKICNNYFDSMRNSNILVTVNPAHWEGDFRLWEVSILCVCVCVCVCEFKVILLLLL